MGYPMEVKTDKERGQEIAQRAARIAEITQGGWMRVVGQGRAAYTKDGNYLDRNGEPCADPNAKPKKAAKKSANPDVGHTPDEAA